MNKKKIMLLKPECITPGLNVLVDWYADGRDYLRGIVKKKLRKNYLVEAYDDYSDQKRLYSVPYDRLTLNTGFTKEGRRLMATKEDTKYFWSEEHTDWCCSLLIDKVGHTPKMERVNTNG